MKLRPLCEADAPRMLEWMHDPAVNRHFRDDFAHKTPADVQSFIRSAVSGDARPYAICDAAGTYEGTVSLKHIDTASGRAEYAIVLRHDAQGRGYASFATREILRIAFQELGLRCVYLNVRQENTHAIAFYEHIGFRRLQGANPYPVPDDAPDGLLWYDIENM